MELNKKDNLSNLTNQVQTLNTLQSEYFNLLSLINDMREILNNSYNSEKEQYEQEGIDKLINTIEGQIDGCYKTSLEISDQNYYINAISKDLTAKINEEIISL